QRVDELSHRADELGVRVFALESPARVHRVAVRRLGMVPATGPSFLTLRPPPSGRRASGPGGAPRRQGGRGGEAGSDRSPVEAAAGPRR
ncbi:MAG: hypothetical protein KY434_10875, partial [Actinobacteria bacterium]|nr:hypothetical protein [Actinomycetota bacterium]